MAGSTARAPLLRPLLVALCGWHAPHPAQAVGSDDWLLATVPEAATLTQGELGGVPTLVLSNGLASRVFAMPAPAAPDAALAAAPPPPPPGPCPSWCTGCNAAAEGETLECCANPGGRQVHGPNKGEVYPYFGKPCTQQSDCGQCTVDRKCICGRIAIGGSASCCKPLGPA